MVNLFRRITSSEFNRDVAKVFSGTFLAQIIAIGISPILTRIYSPNDFSNLALYLSVVSILTVIVTFKYDKAIMLPEDDNQALALVVLSTLLTIGISFFFFIIYLFFGSSVAAFFKVKGIQSWLVFVPITILARALYTILNTWFNRKKQYMVLSKNRVFTSTLNGGLKIVFQILGGLGAFGLVLSEAVSQVISLYFFGNRFVRENIQRLKGINKKEIREVANKYKSFPVYSLPADFLSIFSRELPVLMLSGYFGAGVVGFYMLTKRTLDAPFTLLSTSILEVFKQKATEDYQRIGNCKAVFLSTLWKLLLISIVPCFVLFFYAPILFSFIFGAEWEVAGDFARILTLMYFFKFVSSPLSYVFYIVDKLKVDLLLHVFILLIITTSIFIGYSLNGDPYSTLVSFSIGYSIVYIIYISFSYKYSQG